jgi:hypothetical protein
MLLVSTLRLLKPHVIGYVARFVSCLDVEDQRYLLPRDVFAQLLFVVFWDTQYSVDVIENVADNRNMCVRLCRFFYHTHTNEEKNVVLRKLCEAVKVVRFSSTSLLCMLSDLEVFDIFVFEIRSLLNQSEGFIARESHLTGMHRFLKMKYNALNLYCPE